MTDYRKIPLLSMFFKPNQVIGYRKSNSQPASVQVQQPIPSGSGAWPPAPSPAVSFGYYPPQQYYQPYMYPSQAPGPWGPPAPYPQYAQPPMSHREAPLAPPAPHQFAQPSMSHRDAPITPHHNSSRSFTSHGQDSPYSPRLSVIPLAEFCTLTGLGSPERAGLGNLGFRVGDPVNNITVAQWKEAGFRPCEWERFIFEYTKYKKSKTAALVSA